MEEKPEHLEQRDNNLDELRNAGGSPARVEVGTGGEARKIAKAMKAEYWACTKAGQMASQCPIR